MVDCDSVRGCLEHVWEVKTNVRLNPSRELMAKQAKNL